MDATERLRIKCVACDGAEAQHVCELANPGDYEVLLEAGPSYTQAFFRELVAMKFDDIGWDRVAQAIRDGVTSREGSPCPDCGYCGGAHDVECINRMEVT